MNQVFHWKWFVHNASWALNRMLLLFLITLQKKTYSQKESWQSRYCPFDRRDMVRKIIRKSLYEKISKVTLVHDKSSRATVDFTLLPFSTYMHGLYQCCCFFITFVRGNNKKIATTTIPFPCRSFEQMGSAQQSSLYKDISKIYYSKYYVHGQYARHDQLGTLIMSSIKKKHSQLDRHDLYNYSGIRREQILTRNMIQQICFH